jgi:NAD(P)H-dependent FMN reductase
MRIGIIIGTTRPGRMGESIARWVSGRASQRTDPELALVDLMEYGLELV